MRLNSIATRLIVFFLVILALLIVKSIFATKSTEHVIEAQRRAQQSQIEIIEFSDSLAQLRILVFQYLGTQNPMRLDLLRKEIDLLSESLLNASANLDVSKELLQQSLAIYQELLNLHFNFQTTQADKLLNTTSQDQYNALLNLVDAAVMDVEVNAAELVSSSHTRFVTVMTFITLFSVILAAILAFYFIRSILIPIKEVKQITDQIARADLSLPTTTSRKDELGDLLNSTGAMLGRVNLIVETVSILSGTLSSIRDREELLGELVDNIQKRLGYDHVQMLLPDYSQELLYVAFVAGAVDTGSVTEHSTIPMSFAKNTAVQAYLKREIVMGNRLRQKTNRQINPQLAASQSEIAIPLIVDDKVIGVLDVQSHGEDTFSTVDINLLKAMANQGASILENIDSFRKAQIAKNEAEDANRSKSIFLANMSHELRTPLNSILGFSEMIGRNRDTPVSVQEKVSIINRSGEHLLGMINDVLDLSKIEAGRVELEPEAFDLHRMLEDIGNMFEQRARSAGLQFNLEFDSELAQYIACDPGKLRQILINFLGNAAKFTEQGGFALYARTQPISENTEMVMLQAEVEDSGPGIAKEQLKCIFEPFVQAGRSPNTAKGTGLGLAITKSYVELMGGEVWVESEAGKGSLFRVELPVALPEAAEVPGIASDGPEVLGLEPGQTDWRIMVVEDNIDSRLLLSSLLVQVGFGVRQAENGEQAVELFKEWHPHFIWMDMSMPVMDGYEASARIREQPGGGKVKIVAITASAFTEQLKTILESGCNDVVHKPFKSYEIFDAMAEQLGVRYTYKEAVSKPLNDQLEVSADAVAALPQSWQGKLRYAATLLSITDFDTALAPVRERDPELADGLHALAREFCFDRILELLGKAKPTDD